LGFPFSLNFSLYHLRNSGMADPGYSFGDRWAFRFRAITAEPTHDFQPKQCRCAGCSACSLLEAVTHWPFNFALNVFVKPHVPEAGLSFRRRLNACLRAIPGSGKR
jgi:hypothetical protein